MADILQWIADQCSWLAVVAIWVVAARAYPGLPRRIPIHFGFDGRPDGWGSKGMIWLMPILSLVMYFALAAAILAVRHRAPDATVAAALAWLRFETLAMFLFIESRTVAVAHGRAEGLGRSFLPITLVVILGTSLLLSSVAPRHARGRTPAGAGRTTQ